MIDGKTKTSFVVAVFVLCFVSNGYSQDVKPPLSYAEESGRDLKFWRALLESKKYDDLEHISNGLRADPEKYFNGRGKDWKFYWTPLKDDHNRTMKEDDYRQAFDAVEGWLKAKPDSVSARLSLAHLYHRYSFYARGGDFNPETGQLQIFEERNKKAAEYLDEIAKTPNQIDNVYRRLRIEISKGLGIKPNVQIVYDALDDDPLNMELVHGMTICLLPRWFGDAGELEEFANEVVKRSQHACGAFQYLTVVLATKEFLKEYVLLEHDFDIEQIRQGFDAALETYPLANEYFDEEAQLLFLAGDVPGAVAALGKIGDRPNLNRWRYAEINYKDFRRRVTLGLTAGEQFRLIAGSTTPYTLLQPVGNDQALVTLDTAGGVRIYEFKTGTPQQWSYLQGVNPKTASIHSKAGLMAGGSRSDNSAFIYGLRNGQFGRIPTFKKVVTTCFSQQKDLLAIADGQGVITIHDLKTGEQKYRFPPERLRHLIAMAFSPEGDQLVATTRYGKLLFIKFEDEEPQEMRVISQSGLKSLAWSDDHLAVGGWRGKVFIFDRPDFKESASWKHESEAQVASLAFSPDGKRLAIGRSSEKQNEAVEMPLSVWNLHNEDEPKALIGHQLGVNCVRFAEQGKTLVSGSNDWTLRFWKVD